MLEQVLENMSVKRGEIYKIDFGNNTIGSEQSGVRPALIIQNDIGNQFSPTTIVAPITSKIKKHGSRTHIIIEIMGRKSVILLEQMRTVDKTRIIDFICSVSKEVMNEVDKALLLSIGLISLLDNVA